MIKLIYLFFFLAPLSSVIAQNNWVQTNGPCGGFITKTMVDSANNYYVGTEDNGIFISTNEGENWKSISDGLNNYQIFAFTSSQDSLTYASTFYTVKPKVQIFQLRTDSLKWKNALPINPGPFAYSLYKTKFNTLLLGTGGGVLRLKQGIDSLDVSDTILSTKKIISITGDGTDIYSASTSGVYKSTDDGISWKSLLPTVPQGIAIRALYLRLQSKQRRRALFVAGVGPTVIRTTDEGVTWDTVYSAPYQTITDITSNDSLLFLSSVESRVLFSINDGVSWASQNFGLPFATIISLSKTKRKEILAGTYGSGVYKLKFGDTTWVQVSQGLPFASVSTIQTAGHDTIIVGTYFSGVSKSTDGGNSWGQFNRGFTTSYIYSLVRTQSGNLYAGTKDGIYLNQYNSNTWSKINGFEYPIEWLFLSDDALIYFSVPNGIYYIKDGETLVKSIPNTDMSIYSLTQLPQGELYGFAHYKVFYQGQNLLTFGVVTSAGAGGMFTNVLDYQPGVSSDAFPRIGSLGNILFAGGEFMHLVISHDFAKHWVGTSMPYFGINCFLPASDNRMFVGTKFNGIQMSLDTGKSWTSLNSGLTNLQINCLARDSSDYLYLGSGDALLNIGGGVFRSAAPGYQLTIKRSSQIAEAKHDKLLLTEMNRFMHLPSDISSLTIYNSIGQLLFSLSKDQLQRSNLDLYSLLARSGMYNIIINFGKSNSQNYTVIRM
jgi:ligand-binding sensor domain-containing protein